MIRAATHNDVPVLVEMGERFRASVYAHLFPQNLGQFDNIIRRLIDGPDSTILVLDDESGPVGMIGLLLYEHHISGQLVVSEVMWWLEPDHRGYGVKLLTAAEEWAQATGATQLHMIAPDERVGRLYRRKGYQLFEMSFYKPLRSSVRVFDDVRPDFEWYRRRALTQAFSDVDGGNEDIFHGLAEPPDEWLTAWITREFPSLTPTLSFLRRSPAHQVEPNFIHTDTSMGDWTAIAYLTARPPDGDGTQFWRYKPTGAIKSTAGGENWKNRELWEPWRLVPAVPNRVVLFPAPYFHSRAIEDNYGIDDDARLIQVVFGRGALE